MHNVASVIQVQPIEGHCGGDEGGDLSWFSTCDPKVHGLSASWAHRPAIFPQFRSCMLVQSRGDPALDVARQPLARERVGQLDRPKPIHKWVK